jgi:peptide deformylase
MAIHPIVRYGTPVLHSSADPVERIDTPAVRLFDDMVETMLAAPGIGLAAPQIGISKRLIVIDLSVGEDPEQLIKLVNPEIVEQEGEQREEEGCLSVPGFTGTPIRPARVTAKGIDLEGKERIFTATGLLARAFCHEIDHTNGILFVDRLSPLKRDLMKRKLRRKSKSGDWDD